MSWTRPAFLDAGYTKIHTSPSCLAGQLCA